jgi:hypothetical protein
MTPEQFAAQQLELVVVQQAAQERIIVRTVDMAVSVSDVPRVIEDISATARRMGGWIVSMDRSEKHRGFIAARVPAGKLDEALAEIRGYAVDVESETSSSKDVTDEFVDLNSRLRNLESTEQALIRLLDKAVTVEEALKVQTELSRIQGQIEEAQGRIKFLQETSAFSLVNVTVRREPVEMLVDAGADRTISVGQTATFTAKLRPPTGIDRFTITWNFGDGTSPVTTDRTAPTLEEGVLVTASVGHAYFDEKGSPYIVEMKVTGTGDAGTAEGADTMIATVSRLPVIDVFAGNDRTETEGEPVAFRASFTRPLGVEDLQYDWEFGDGAEGASAAVPPGATEVVQTHVFEHHRPQPFAVTIKLLGNSAAGKVEASDTVQVFVRESPNWLGGRWEFGDTTRTATRAISQTAEVAVTAVIWLVIFSPVLAAAGLTAWLAVRASRRRLSRLGGSPGGGGSPGVGE